MIRNYTNSQCSSKSYAGSFLFFPRRQNFGQRLAVAAAFSGSRAQDADGMILAVRFLKSCRQMLFPQLFLVRIPVILPGAPVGKIAAEQCLVRSKTQIVNVLSLGQGRYQIF